MGNLGDIPLNPEEPEVPLLQVVVGGLILLEVLDHGLGDIWLMDIDFDMSESVRLTGLLGVGDFEAALF